MGKRVSIGLGGIDAIKTQLGNITRSIALLKEFIETYELQAAEDPDDEKAPTMSKGDVTLTREEADWLTDCLILGENYATHAGVPGNDHHRKFRLAKEMLNSKLSAAEGEKCEPSFDVVDARTMENLVRPLSEWIQRRDALRNEKPCPECGGSGEAGDRIRRCLACSGTGKVEP